ncbi:lipopolysaccharide biosynthesis protein [Carboxylicivirga marina]|uniref:lipopolysaccharide biosynthesis protein n=1 Tax=Carboxylicivirga marina TaxID=2800988 RepID=UPI002599F826|nr:hypothetical protein [uncultured Carboxylicivirga sp.]
MGRVKKTLLNARVNLIYYILVIVVSFFSRKIFLDYLNADFVGLTSTLRSILGFLNLAELGIGVAIGQVLYSPIAKDDKHKINEILSLYGYLYKKVGIVILVVGIIISFFLPLIFEKSIFNNIVIFFGYYVFLGSSLLSYFFNYQQTLLQADQKGYIVQKYYQSFVLFKLLLQILLVYHTQNYIIWILIEFMGSVAYTIILKWRMAKEYPWMSISVQEGRLLLKKYRYIILKIKQLFVHKFSLFILQSSSPFIIYAFISLKYVAYYNNYMLIFGKLTGLIGTVLQSSWAGVGNLVAEGNKSNILKIFWELTGLRLWIGGIIVMCLYYLTEPFITIWIGAEYLLSKDVLLIMLIQVFLMQIRGPIDNYIYAYGLFSDVWAPLLEGVINITVALIGGKYFGLSGIVAGSVLSILVVVFGWKPYFLFKKGFLLPVSLYFKNIIPKVLLLGLAWYIVDYLVTELIIGKLILDSYMNWLMFSVVICLIVFFVWTPILFFSSRGFRELMSRFRKYVLNIVTESK